MPASQDSPVSITPSPHVVDDELDEVDVEDWDVLVDDELEPGDVDVLEYDELEYDVLEPGDVDLLE